MSSITVSNKFIIFLLSILLQCIASAFLDSQRRISHVLCESALPLTVLIGILISRDISNIYTLTFIGHCLLTILLFISAKRSQTQSAFSLLSAKSPIISFNYFRTDVLPMITIIIFPYLVTLVDTLYIQNQSIIELRLMLFVRLLGVVVSLASYSLVRLVLSAHPENNPSIIYYLI